MKKITQNPTVVLVFRIFVILANVVIISISMSVVAVRSIDSRIDFIGIGISMLALICAFVPVKRSNVLAVVITLISIAYKVLSAIGII